tara:strand:+ start:6742 stop:6948 length:207 start_codon:yes stop_codon:yes gene_type:complete
MLVDIDFVLMAEKRLAEINAQSLGSIEWVRDGKRVHFTKEQIEHLDFTGLSNVDILFNYKPTLTVEVK